MRCEKGWRGMGRRLACVLVSLALGGIVFQAIASVAPGKGLRVTPGALFVQGVFLGKLYDVYEASGIRLTIHNDSDREQTYVLSTHRPSEVGLRGWLHGYAALPDPRWFWFDREEVVVGPQSEGHVNMFFEIPQEERYYNQHWVFALGIKGKPGTGMVQIALYPKIQIETISKETVTARPDGPLGLEPSVISIYNLALGAPRQATLRLYNNDAETRRYRLTSKTFPAQAGKLPPISVSGGYAWIPEPGWISTTRDWVTVGPQESAAVPLRITIPKGPGHRGRNWESILFIESEDGRTRFARVQIQTEKKEAYSRGSGK